MHPFIVPWKLINTLFLPKGLLRKTCNFLNFGNCLWYFLTQVFNIRMLITYLNKSDLINSQKCSYQLSCLCGYVEKRSQKDAISYSFQGKSQLCSFTSTFSCRDLQLLYFNDNLFHHWFFKTVLWNAQVWPWTNFTTNCLGKQNKTKKHKQKNPTTHTEPFFSPLICIILLVQLRVADWVNLSSYQLECSRLNTK